LRVKVADVRIIIKLKEMNLGVKKDIMKQSTFITHCLIGTLSGSGKFLEDNLSLIEKYFK